MNTVMKSNAVEQLESLRTQLGVALVQQDWTRIASLDQDCRVLVDLAMQEVTASEESALRNNLQGLVDLYKLVTLACQQQRNQVGEELSNLNKARQSAKVYQLFG